MLGPTRFLIYINDLPSVIHSFIFLFAGDAKIFRVIRHIEDPTFLLGDLASLQHIGVPNGFFPYTQTNANT